MKQRTPPVDWAELLRRTFDLDVFACMRCGGRRWVLAYVKGAGGLRAILEHLGSHPRQSLPGSLIGGEPLAACLPLTT